MCLQNKSRITFDASFFPFPDRGEVRGALRTPERLWRGRAATVLSYEVYHMLQANQVDELGVGGVWNEMHLGRRRLRGWNLKMNLYKKIMQFPGGGKK